jgi:hypothetical protein
MTMKEFDHSDQFGAVIEQELDRVRAKLRKRQYRVPSEQDLEAARQELGPDPTVVEAISNWCRMKPST